MDPQLVVEVRQEGRVRVLMLSGELELASSGALERSLNDVSDCDRIVIDMSGIDFLDSTGLSILMVARKKAVAAGRGFRLANGSAQVQRVLALTGLEHWLTVTDALE